MRRRLALVAWLALGWIALAWPAAAAKYRGSDLLGNVAPESQLGGGLVDRYPLSAYSLDYHVDVGVTDMGGVPPTIAQWAAAQLWSATSFLIKTVIDVFTWAFSLDLLGGASDQAGDGALAPISEAIASLYENVIGEAWMVAAILIAGIWGIWKALVQRRYTETAGALAVSVLCVVVALFFVYQPERTIGEASRATNTLSLAFLAGANSGSLDDPAQAKRQVADHLFETLVYRPWVVLEFGGLRHCVDTDRLDDDGFPRAVGPHDPSRDVCRDHVRPGRDGHGGYAPRYLRQPAGSDERKAEYDALREGEAPEDDPQFAGYRVDKADAPAVDIQQAGGAFQRLTFSVVVFIGALGAIALLGFLSLAVILAQVVALVLLGFAPVALVIGIFPGAGHDFFRGWLTKLATAVFIKALYSLVIALVVAVSAALASATDELGFLFAFGLQTRLLLGDLPLPQADHRAARRRHHRRGPAGRDAADDDGAARRPRGGATVHRARRNRPAARFRGQGRAPGERARRRRGYNARERNQRRRHRAARRVDARHRRPQRQRQRSRRAIHPAPDGRRSAPGRRRPATAPSPSPLTARAATSTDESRQPAAAAQRAAGARREPAPVARRRDAPRSRAAAAGARRRTGPGGAWCLTGSDCSSTAR